MYFYNNTNNVEQSSVTQYADDGKILATYYARTDHNGNVTHSVYMADSPSESEVSPQEYRLVQALAYGDERRKQNKGN